MKRWVVRGLTIAALAGAGWAAWHYLFPNPEQVIRKRLRDLARLASFSAKEGPLATAFNSQKLASLFTANVVLVLDIPGSSVQTWNGRDTIADVAMRARNALSELQLSFPDIDVKVSPGNQDAIVHVTARIDYPGQKTPDVQELKMTLEKSGGDWLISRVETVRTLLQQYRTPIEDNSYFCGSVRAGALRRDAQGGRKRHPPDAPARRPPQTAAVRPERLHFASRRG